MTTFVLVHGGWDGAWAWRPVAQELQRRGHAVYTPTLTGSGERVHLASREVGLHTHILDVVNVLRFEQLTDVVLVGFSYGGMVATGVAEELPDQISHLICLDGFVPANGQSIADLLGPQIMGALNDVAQRYGDGWRVPFDPPDADRRTDLLLRTAEEPLTVNSPEATRLKHTYVLFTAKPADDWLAPVMERIAERVRQDGWNYRQAAFGHFPLLDFPHEVVELILSL